MGIDFDFGLCFIWSMVTSMSSFGRFPITYFIEESDQLTASANQTTKMEAY